MARIFHHTIRAVDIWVFYLTLGLLLQAKVDAQEKIRSFYVFDGKNLTKIEDKDADQVKVTEWQVWLYEAGQSTADQKKRWGVISGKTAAGVMAQLKKAQSFELTFNGSFGGERVPDKVYTHFNPLGPIAILGKASPAKGRQDQQPLISKETWDKIQDVVGRAQEYHEAYQNISDILSREPKTQTPFDNVGSVLREYRDNLQDMMEKVTNLRRLIEGNTAPTLDDITKMLNEVNHQFDMVENSARRASRDYNIPDSLLIPPRGQLENSASNKQTADQAASKSRIETQGGEAKTGANRRLSNFEHVDGNNPQTNKRASPSPSDVNSTASSPPSWLRPSQSGAASPTTKASGSAQFDKNDRAILIIIDISDSMNEDNKIAAAKQGAIEGIRSATGQGIWYSVIAFGGECDNGVRLVQGWTKTATNAVVAIGNLEANGSTPLAPAVEYSIDHLRRFVASGKGGVILLADGQNSCGDSGAIQAALRRMKSFGLAVHYETIGVGVSSDAAEDLKAIAYSTGGSYTSAPSVSHIKGAFQSSFENLRKFILDWRW